MSIPLLPICYLPPLNYYSLLKANPTVGLEYFEHFEKQTYRNRCYIYSPNGKQLLAVPLQQRSERTLTKDIRISYTDNWHQLHWRSMEAAYRRSAYFEYYEDDFAPIYLNYKPEFLIDFNLKLIETINRLLKLNPEFVPTTKYEASGEFIDYRLQMSPKVKVGGIATSSVQPYPQVFDAKFGFIAQLSIIDLLFNQGPHSVSFL